MGSALRVMGIDPGLTRLGYGLLEESGCRLTALASGVVTTDKDGGTCRLVEIFERLSELMRRWSPEEVAVERVFMKANQKTAVGAIQAAGVAQVAAKLCGAAVFEYAPAEVKQSVVGTGNGAKEQVRFMVTRLLGAEAPRSPDAADALAVAITHIHSRRLPILAEQAQ